MLFATCCPDKVTFHYLIPLPNTLPYFICICQMIFWVKWAWGHWYCYRSSNTGYFEAKQIISFFATAFNETGFFRAHFLVKQDYTWETEKLLLIETDFQESSFQLTGQARAAIPFNTCCHWMGFSHLLYLYCSHWICQDFCGLVILHRRLGHFCGSVSEFRVLAAPSNCLKSYYT